MQLHYRKYGDGEPLIILHGLFGSADNWHSLARRWGKHYKVFALDQRNHGSSPHESIMNYEEMVQDLYDFITTNRLESAHIIGHSMGGKVAMLFASAYPDLAKSLVILDIGIEQVTNRHTDILKVLRTIHPHEHTSRETLDRLLQNYIPGLPVRQFLMKNVLRRMDGSLAWKFNQDALLDHYADITAGIELDAPYLGSVLFLRGNNSDYLEPEISVEILESFPLAQLKSIDDAGHWLHADQPEQVFSQVLEFLR